MEGSARQDNSDSDSGSPTEKPAGIHPKRGAIPTPKKEIAEATPYVPDVDEAGGTAAGTSPPAVPDKPKI